MHTDLERKMPVKGGGMEINRDIEKMSQERHELLIRLQDSLREEMIACETLEPENKEEPEILTVVLDSFGDEEREGGAGEFFFLPMSSEEDMVQYFCAVLTLADDIPGENLTALFEAMSYINFVLPCGSYCIDKNRSFLTYKLTVPLPIGLCGDALYEQMNICVSNAVNTADTFSDVLIKIAYGEATEDLKELLGAW